MKQNPYLPGTPDEFISKNKRLAHHLALKFARPGKDIEEIHAIALYGLVKAYDGFNPTGHDGTEGKPIKFATYAAATINGFIMTYLRTVARPIHLGRKHIDLIAKMNSAGLMGNETIEEIATKAGMSIDDVNEAIMASVAVNVDSLDREIKMDDNDMILAEVLGENDEGYEMVDGNDDKELLNEFVASLPLRLQKIYQFRFVEEKSQDKAAKSMGVSQSYVARLEAKFMKDARKWGKRKGFICGDNVSSEQKEVVKMRTKYPEALKERIKELSSTATAGNVYKTLKEEFPDVVIPYPTVATMISQYRKEKLAPKSDQERGSSEVSGETTTRKVTPNEAKAYGIKTPIDNMEWFEDISVPTIPSIGINRAGISINAAALQEMKLKVGEPVRIGFLPDGRIFVGQHTQGLALKEQKPSGAIIGSKRMAEWLGKKGVSFKRYPIGFDEQMQMYYAKVVD